MSLGTNQFWGRMLMFFMQPSKYPVQPYTQYMKPSRMHMFTAIQLFFFALLYVVKSIKVIAIAFPIVIAACIPIRLYLLPKIFTRDELILIDSDPNTVKMWIENKELAKEQDAEGKPLLASDEDPNGSENGDVETGQVIDQVKPPPTPRRRARRTKSVSCPTGSLMFASSKATHEIRIIRCKLTPLRCSISTNI